MSLILRNGEQEVVLFDSTESTVPRKTINIDNKKDIIHRDLQTTLVQYSDVSIVRLNETHNQHR